MPVINTTEKQFACPKILIYSDDGLIVGEI
jgi:hypothetical protein